MDKSFRDFLDSGEPVFFDGAMGTEFVRRGFFYSEGCREALNVTNPDFIREIHKSYIDVGSNVITSNTFGMHAYKLSEYGYEDRLEEFCTAGIKIAKEVAGDKAYVAASIGPIGKLLEPLGDLSFDDAYNMYLRVMKAFNKAKPDLIILETMLDMQEARIGLLAAHEAGDIPCIVSMTFEEGKRTTCGNPPEAAAAVFDSMGAVAVGANCSTGPDELINVAKSMANISSIPILIQSNAGIPVDKDGETVFPLGADEYAEFGQKLVEAGTRIFGGCCGTTPLHIKKLKENILSLDKKNIKNFNSENQKSFLTSGTKLIEVESYPIIVGERINPNAQKRIAQDLKEEKFSYILEEADNQAKAGADILDINVSVSFGDESKLMREAVKEISRKVDLPLCIDSTDYRALEEGLKYFPGKALINSVDGEKKKIDKVLPLAKKYGAAIVGLTMDEKGIPDSVEERVRIAGDIIKACDKIGIPRSDIYIDTLVLTVSTNPNGAKVTLDSIRKIKEAFGVRTILGLSNISFGLPGRAVLNASFLSMAIEAGLDACITNPGNDIVRNTFYGASLLAGYDKGAKKYIDSFYKLEEEKNINEEKDLKYAIINGAKESALDLAAEELKIKEPLEIIDNIIIPALDIVGKKYESKEYFLPQLLLSAETAKNVTSFLQSNMKEGSQLQDKATIVFATVKGDLHDIGKNIVISVLKNYGYNIIDLGKGVDTDTIINTALENDAKVIALSALMTTTMSEMKELVDKLKEMKLRDKFKILIGGAVIDDDYASAIGSDGYAGDPTATVKLLRKLGF